MKKLVNPSLFIERLQKTDIKNPLKGLNWFVLLKPLTSAAPNIMKIHMNTLKEHWDAALGNALIKFSTELDERRKGRISNDDFAMIASFALCYVYENKMELAEKAGIDPTTVLRWSSGKNSPSQPTKKHVSGLISSDLKIKIQTLKPQ